MTISQQMLTTILLPQPDAQVPKTNFSASAMSTLLQSKTLAPRSLRLGLLVLLLFYL